MVVTASVVQYDGSKHMDDTFRDTVLTRLIRATFRSGAIAVSSDDHLKALFILTAIRLDFLDCSEGQHENTKA
ncbi:hypothetical protein [Rhizobium wenxiniae]|uniref:hypothetical protein n=1 Tax=Rhizobium wenxiniae TaxID=1737357 RepID=UPI001C6DDAEA|nr:hypothetical protein [Rhizobium wenxiniae]